MSEFSESFHLRSHSAADAVALLERASARGFVFQPKDGWVPFVCGGSKADIARAVAARPDLPPEIAEWMATQSADKAATARIATANTSTLLHYSFAADHGMTVELFEAAKLSGRIEIGFEDGECELDAAAFVQSGVLTTAAAAELEAWLATASEYFNRQLALLKASNAATDDAARDVLHERYLADRYFVARILGLTDYAWLSYGYQVDQEDSPDRIAVP